MTEKLEFQFDGAKVRVILDTKGSPWWVTREVCSSLGIENHRDATARLSCDERGSVLVDTLGGPQTMSAVNEPGLYRLIFQSRKPAAERFKRWLAHDVLPVLRRTGSYTPAHAPDCPGSLPVDIDEWLSLVREARMTFGRAAARRIWQRSPLPAIATSGEVDDPTERYCAEFIQQCCNVTGQGSDFVRSRELINAAMNWRPNGWPGERSFSNAMLRLARASSDDFGVLMFWQSKRSHAGFRGIKLR